jgi:UDP-N-acetylmuramoyl-tripeptide--D-alanyl-D-alanine ligase
MSGSTVLWTSDEAAAATGGQSQGAWAARGISIDTRTLAQGDLYIALKGEHRDGHAFVSQALEKGAAAAMVSQGADVAYRAPLLVVADTQKGLEDLGRASRARARAKIVAVTGSAGKTTTKEMLNLMLAGEGETLASAASYNNHWGVPLSLARMPRSARYGVFEIGMNHAGEIRALVAQVRPHVAVITTIAPAHLEYFGTIEKIADAKAEIFEGIEPGGAALIPAANSQAERLIAHARAAGVKNILTFGDKEGADARLLAATPTGAGQKISAEIMGEQIEFVLGAPGAHIASNALGALLAVKCAGADMARAAAALKNFAPLSGRGASFRAAGADIIDESYNANPASMAAALSLLGEWPAKGLRIAVLGDMLELGPQSAELHSGLASSIAAAGTDLVFLCGAQMKALWDALPASIRARHAGQSEDLVGPLLETIKPGDAVLVKGSFGSRMAVVINALKARAAA